MILPSFLSPTASLLSVFSVRCVLFRSIPLFVVVVVVQGRLFPKPFFNHTPFSSPTLFRSRSFQGNSTAPSPDSPARSVTLLEICTRTISSDTLLRIIINYIYIRVYVSTIRSLFYDHRSRIDPRSNVLSITGKNNFRTNPAGSSGLIAVEDATPTWRAPPCASSHPRESCPCRNGTFRARSYRIRRSLHCSPGLLVNFDLFRFIM